MSSVFIYHLNQPTPKTNFSNDNAMLFPEPREIKPFTLVSGDQQKFDLKNFYGHWNLVFFGFTHCSEVCPTTFTTISQAYPQLKVVDPKLRVVLVSVDPDRDTPESLLKYATNFNPEFQGVTGKINEIRQLQSQLGIYSARDDSTGNNYQINHTSSILLINPQGKWAGTIRYGLTPDQFAQAFKEVVASS